MVYNSVQSGRRAEKIRYYDTNHRVLRGLTEGSDWEVRRKYLRWEIEGWMAF